MWSFPDSHSEPRPAGRATTNAASSASGVALPSGRGSVCSQPCRLLLNHCPIPSPDLPPAAVQSFPLAFLEASERILRRGLLIHFDAPAWRVIRIPIAVLHHRTTRSEEHT